MLEKGTKTTEPAPQRPGMTFERIPTEFYPERTGFRANTRMITLKMNFIFVNGGLGDYLCWIPALQWLASQATWIEGNAIIPKYFVEIAEYFLKPFPKWAHHEYNDLAQIPKVDQMAFRGPVELQRESLNATGAHLLTCGWVYFTNKEKAPPGWENYPRFAPEDLEKIELPEAAKPLRPKTYAVVTTGMTTNSRKVPPGGWNAVIEHVRARGLTPVLLGKSVMETGNARNIHTTFDGALRTEGCVDLRDKTSLMQAASIMSGAACVIGHDNGLLHLAGCTDVPIVFGYNMASPEHRQPIRKVGRVYNVFLTKEELACTFCQSNTNFVIGYNFRDCFYGDMICMQKLFSDGAARWKTQIDLALGENECLDSKEHAHQRWGI